MKLQLCLLCCTIQVVLGDIGSDDSVCSLVKLHGNVADLWNNFTNAVNSQLSEPDPSLRSALQIGKSLWLQRVLEKASKRVLSDTVLNDISIKYQAQSKKVLATRLSATPPESILPERNYTLPNPFIIDQLKKKQPVLVFLISFSVWFGAIIISTTIYRCFPGLPTQGRNEFSPTEPE